MILKKGELTFGEGRSNYKNEVFIEYYQKYNKFINIISD